MKIKALIFCSMFLIAGCTSTVSVNSPNNTNNSQPINNGWKKFEVSNTTSKFSFYLPSDFAEVAVQGEDSLVKQYKNANSNINLDFGGYSDPLDSYKSMAEYQEINTTISGKIAKIISYKNNDEYISAVNFPEITNGLKLTISINSSDKNIKDTAKKIFESISF